MENVLSIDTASLSCTLNLLELYRIGMVAVSREMSCGPFILPPAARPFRSNPLHTKITVPAVGSHGVFERLTKKDTIIFPNISKQTLS